MKTKKAFEMSFNWIFALIAGGAILFLAIYGVSKFIDAGKTVAYTEIASQISAYLDPFQAGAASGKFSQMSFKKQAEVYFSCADYPAPFGKQTIAFSQEDIGDEKKGEQITFKDKYVFAEEPVKGKNMYIYSKPFDIPFKTADLIIFTSKNYCFKMATNNIKDELTNSEVINVKFENCNETDIEVCFGRVDCDISVRGECSEINCDDEYDYGYVLKDNKKLYYSGNLLYGAIVSSPELYECNVMRLAGRFSELGKVYLDKMNFIETTGCGSDIRSDLEIMISEAQALKSSSQIIELAKKAEIMDAKNEFALCKVY